MTNTMTFKAPHSYDYQEGRCLLCDARYCTDGCFADAPGATYVTGTGWIWTGTPREVLTETLQREFAFLARLLEGGACPEDLIIGRHLSVVSNLVEIARGHTPARVS